MFRSSKKAMYSHLINFIALRAKKKKVMNGKHQAMWKNRVREGMLALGCSRGL